MNLYSDIFNLRGNSYNQAMDDHPEVRQREFQQLIALAELSPGNRLLDVPSGGGYLASYLNADVQLVGVETSALFMGQLAQKTYTECHQVPSLTQIPLAENSLDVIFSLAGLHHVAEREQVYREFRRLLKPGGRLVMADVALGTKVAQFLNGFVDKHCSLGHKGDFWGEELVGQLQRSGFNLAYDQLVDAQWQFSSIDTMGQFCQQLFGLSLASVGQVIDALCSQLPVTQEAKGRITLGWQLRYIKAL